MQIVRIGKFRNPPYEERVTCPRCNGNTLPIGYPGALSRVDNKTEICSPCGQDEGFRDFFDNRLSQLNEWPVDIKYGINADGTIQS
jgi:transcription elongation factor Elf1